MASLRRARKEVHMKGFVARYYLDECCKTSMKEDSDHSYFLWLFERALNVLTLFYWTYAKDDVPLSPRSFRNKEESEYYFYHLAEELSDVAEPSTFFPKHARWIRDDNTDLFGFIRKPDEAKARIFYDGQYDDRDIYQHVDLFFSNYDAVWWECYAKDDAIFQQCLDSVKHMLKDECIDFLDFSERDAYYTKQLGG